MTMTSEEAQRAREVLTAQASTARDLKIARAESVLRHQDEKQHVMWANVELETRDLAQLAADADIEAKLLWLNYGHRVLGEEL